MSERAYPYNKTTYMAAPSIILAARQYERCELRTLAIIREGQGLLRDGLRQEYYDLTAKIHEAIRDKNSAWKILCAVLPAIEGRVRVDDVVYFLIRDHPQRWGRIDLTTCPDLAGPDARKPKGG